MGQKVKKKKKDYAPMVYAYLMNSLLCFINNIAYVNFTFILYKMKLK